MVKEAAKTAKVKMPTAEKRNLQNDRKRLRNRSFKASVRTVVRDFDESLKSNDPAVIKDHLNKAYSALDKAAKRGIFKENKAARSKARLYAQAASIIAK